MNNKRRAIFGWVLYDWANSAFAMTVLAAFFPVFFKSFWCSGSSYTTTRLGLGNAFAGIIIAFSSPILGALADAGRNRKKYLITFMLVGSIITAGFSLVGAGEWQWALALFVIANIGWSCANLFYDSLLLLVTDGKRMDFYSSIGYSVGYIGCGILFALNILMVSKPSVFGLKDAGAAVKASFLSVSAWWLLFSIPLILFVHEPCDKDKKSVTHIVADGFTQLRQTLRDILANRHILLFLIAYWLYIDGVDTFIRMAADLGLSIGLDAGSLMISLLIVQLVAFPSALVFGLIAQKSSARVSILIGICIYVFVTIVGPMWVKTSVQYRIMAVLSAIPLGCLQALSRSYFAAIIPEERSAEFFGFYNMMGKFAAILGPAIVGIVAYLFERNGASSNIAARYGFSAISILFITGGIILVMSGRTKN